MMHDTINNKITITLFENISLPSQSKPYAQNRYDEKLNFITSKFTQATYVRKLLFIYLKYVYCVIRASHQLQRNQLFPSINYKISIFGFEKDKKKQFDIDNLTSQTDADILLFKSIAIIRTRQRNQFYFPSGPPHFVKSHQCHCVPTDGADRRLYRASISLFRLVINFVFNVHRILLISIKQQVYQYQKEQKTLIAPMARL